MKNNFQYTEGGGFMPSISVNPDAIEFLIVDLFCGAGGTSTGFTNAMIDGKRIALVMACVNHDYKAIKSHWQNHPEVIHFEEDIRTLELSGLIQIVEKYRILYPNAKVILWGSLECTNFSKAKGGQPRDADSRTLADHLERYVLALNPDYVQIENVVEFMSWGPLNKEGKPVSKKYGSDFMRWRGEICEMGYYDQWKEINSADFGAYTSRNRLFGCFAKHGLPIVWPEPTHAKKPVQNGMFGTLKKWMPVKDVLDFDDEGSSIFNRKKPLVDASLERIYAGLIKFVAGGKDAFMVQYNSGSTENRVNDLERPCNTIPTNNRFALAQTSFLSKSFSGRPAGKVIPVTGPAGTITTFGGQSLVQVQPFLLKYNSMAVNGDKTHCVGSVDNPAPTVTTFGCANIVQVQPFILNTNFKNVGSSIEEPSKTLLASRHHSYVVNPCFLAKYYGNGDNISSVEEPAGTIPTKDRFSKVQPVWLDKIYRGPGNVSSIEDPAGTIMTNKHRMVTCEPFILNPSHGGHCMGTDAPCPVIVARQDKAPLYLIQSTKGNELVFSDEGLLTYLDHQFIEDNDISIFGPRLLKSIRIKIIEFMFMYGVSDIKMRMLKIPELILIQGLTDSKGKPMELFGNQTDQKKQIGNSVVPLVPENMSKAMAIKIREIRLTA